MPLSTFDFLKNSTPEGGFYLDEEQREALQNTLFGMLKDLSALAEENGIPLYLSGGTVLGALRHGGFIPWDDDIDVNLERRYYDRFFSLLREQRGEIYWLHTPEETAGYGVLSSRIRLKGTEVRQREDAYSNECGACIDVFPIENVFDNALLRRLQGILSMGCGFLLSCRKFYRDRKELKPLFYAAQGGRMVFRTKCSVGFLVSWGSVDLWTHVTRCVYSLCRDVDTRLVAIPSGRRHFSREIYERVSFCSRAKLRFEGQDFYATADPDAYMKALFGEDYMTLPPPEKREKHIFYSFSLKNAAIPPLG